MFNIAKQTVIVSEGLFEEHPESYCPRVFVADAEPVHKVYELLMDGQAIPWDCLPQKESCGFDFWTIYVDSTYYDVVMNRAPRVLPTEIVDLPYFVGAKEWKERHGDVVPQFDSETCPATTGAGYCTCKIHSSTHSSLDHLPEGSH